MTMTPSSYHHGDLRESLVESALRILEVEPVEAVTLRRLAREAGVTHAAPYHHFPDRRALLGAVAARGFQDLHAEMTGRTGSGGDPFTRLRAAGTAYVTFAVEHPELFRLMFSGRWKDSTDPPGLREAETRAFGALQGMLGEALPDGLERSEQVQAARAAWAMVHGAAVLLIDGVLDMPPGLDPTEAASRLAEDLTGVLGRGLRSL
jgi:AcrR family transcriptional regulator